MADHSNMKLGRSAVKTDPRTLKLSPYLKPGLPAPPPAKDWTHGITGWGMMLNDTLDDCTIAAAGHAVQVWTANTGQLLTVTDQIIESYYEKWDGYIPNDAGTDKGGTALDVLKQWQQQNFAGHKLLAFAAPAAGNLTEIRQSIALFGGVYIGLALPLTSQTQDVWDVVPGAGANGVKGSWGGHCVFVPRYDENGFTCVTWGQLKTMTLAFWNAYCDEAYVLLGQNWLTSTGSAAGIELAQLEADIKEIQAPAKQANSQPGASN